MNIRNFFSQFSRAVRGGQTLDLTTGDTFTVNGNLLVSGSLTAGSVGIGPACFKVDLDALTSLISPGSFIWTNTSGISLTITSAAVAYVVAAPATATLDLRKISAGLNAVTTGVSLLSGVVALDAAANTLIQPTLTATLTNRIVANLEKVAIATGGAAATGLRGGVMTVYYRP